MRIRQETNALLDGPVDAKRPGGFIDNVHFNVSRYGVFQDNTKDISIGSIQVFRSTFYRDETENVAVKLIDVDKALIGNIEFRPAYDTYTGTSDGINLTNCTDIQISSLQTENSTNALNMADCDSVSVASSFNVNTTTGVRVLTSTNIYMPLSIVGVANRENIDTSSSVNRGTVFGWGTRSTTEVITGAGTDTDGVSPSHFKRMRFNGSGYTVDITPVTTLAVRGDILERHLNVTNSGITVNINSSDGGLSVALTGSVASYSATWVFNNSSWVVKSVAEVLN